MIFRILCCVFLPTVQLISTVKVPYPTHPDLIELSQSLRVYLLENFLSYAECDYIIAKARPHLKRSFVVDESGKQLGYEDYSRTSQGMFFPQNPKDRILKEIEHRIALITGIPIENGEGMQVLHYGPGEEYRPHYDYFDRSTKGGQQCLERGGQRIATFIIYLHDTEDGGETIFPKADLVIRPVKGNAVLFYNCLPKGTEDSQSFHGGAPVIKGEKWIITKWFREKPFK